MHTSESLNMLVTNTVFAPNSLYLSWTLLNVTMLHLQNGSLQNGVLLWKRNVDKRFEGVDDCMVCFSVIHNSNYQLPRLTCRVCKKKFHSACLVSCDLIHWPPGRWASNFKSVISEHMLWIKFMRISYMKSLSGECHRTLWWWVNIVSGNGLVPSSNKPNLPELMLTQISVPIRCH